jgi:hypothetical protein
MVLESLSELGPGTHYDYYDILQYSNKTYKGNCISTTKERFSHAVARYEISHNQLNQLNHLN